MKVYGDDNKLRMTGLHETSSYDKFGFVIAGQNSAGEYLSDVLRYSVEQNSWEELSSFPGGPRGYAYGVADDLYAYIGFGSNYNGYPTDWWRYDMVNDSWLELASFPYLGRDHPAMILADNKIEYRTGVVYSTNRRVWEHDEKFKKYLRKVRVMGIDMETATIFITGFANEINRGALLLVSDTPMTPEGVKTQEKDAEVTRKYVDLHIDMGIEAMTRIGDEGEQIKHFKY